jgi:hypothetical protein
VTLYPIVKTVDLSDVIPGSQFFRWQQALWLPKWKIYCYPTQEQALEIIGIARALDIIRVRCGRPIAIESWLRPDNYNQWAPPYGVSGSKLSAHRLGMAVDFTVATMPCDQVRDIIKPELERLKLRLENLPGSSWVHVDRREPGGGGRFFIP